MSPEDWQKIKVILADAAAVSPSGRADFFRSACGGDAELRREVESLMAFDDADGCILDDPPYSIAVAADETEQTSSFLGRVIGNYFVVDVIAAGGMGTVFLAERADGEFDQKVALKVIKRGMDSDAVLRRFYNERRILASLEHPLIARLIDGGTTDDHVPYFVMEYVAGVPITEFVEQNALTIDETLRLFVKVASAISYAHQNLVIHRDIKPSNILVTPSGEPKLLDFGIAKLLMAGNGGIVTATQQFVLTPDYASPEQVRGEQLSTATDIYSLGVILYELLAGSRPYHADSGNFGDIVRVVCETMPQAPSRARPRERSKLNRDLDNIVLKALRKEPERRYSSVEQFSGDVRRHLMRLPVLAASDSWNYRASKFISRHRYSVLTTLLILITLLSGLAATMYQMNVARRERAKSEQRFKDVRDLANSFIFEVNDKIDESPILARELLINRAIEYLDKLAQETDGDTDLLSELATAYEKIGKVQAELFHPGLGKTSDALESHKKALAIREMLFDTNQNDIARGSDVVRSLMLVGDIDSMTGRIATAREQYLQAAALGQRLLAIDPSSPEIRNGLSRVNARLGQNVLRSGSLARALEYYEISLRIDQQLLAESPEDRTRQHSLSVIYNYIGWVKLEMLRLDEAADFFSRALGIDERLYAADPTNVQYRDFYSDGLLWMGISANAGGDSATALGYIRRSLDLKKAQYEADPANVGNRNGLADCYIEIGRAFAGLRQFREADQAFDQAIHNYDAVWKADPQNLNARAQVLIAQSELADTLLKKGDTVRARGIYETVITDYELLIASEPDNTNWQNALAHTQLDLAEDLFNAGRHDAAQPFLRSSAVTFARLVAASPENARLRRDADRAANYVQKP